MPPAYHGIPEITLSRLGDINITNDTSLELQWNSADWTWLGFKMRYTLPVTILFIMAYTIVFVVGIVGNLLVIVAVSSERPLRRMPTNIYLVNLAFADLLVIVLCYPFTLIATLTVEWHLGEWICKLIPYLQGMSVNASINTLMVISVERWKSICYPLSKYEANTSFVLAIIWLVSLIIPMPWLVYFDVQPLGPDSENMQICMENWPTAAMGNTYFVVANICLCYVFPLSVIGACYMLIWKKVSCRQVPGESVPKVVVLMQRCKVRVFNMILYVVALFTISWLPLYMIFSVIKFFSLPPDAEAMVENCLPIAQWLGTLNSCLNPLIYAIKDEKYRKAYWKVFERKLFGSVDSGNSSIRNLTNQRRKKPIIHQPIDPICSNTDENQCSTTSCTGTSTDTKTMDADRVIRHKTMFAKNMTFTNFKVLTGYVFGKAGGLLRHLYKIGSQSSVSVVTGNEQTADTHSTDNQNTDRTIEQQDN
ncbi:G protein-coupled receptor, rhodopsin-like,GPCR, rhodopsin-like, 7TM [Cinara cedri]|uniref:G protein-coupled receptor, rhodopsin-like,GPCR, rhodopsin-like, 7TM n=1 Tax=Cinara cedri TaxID=506608 RepID=A0A5E4M3K2_9HEMI|nr:G protein-coupled receptor, rhodopsin-like,GPCR, rhodopsin-like, 7TM [Cinara cedri]